MLDDGLNNEIFNTVTQLRDRGFRLYDPPMLIGCYDPAGDGKDRDAYVMIAREEWRRGELHDPDLAVEMILRIYMARQMPAGLELPDKIAHLLSYARSAGQWTQDGRAYGYVMGVETNGVGYGVASTLRTKTRFPVVAYTTVGNTSNKTSSAKKAAMPRLAALDHLRLQLELNRLKAVKGAPGLRSLMSELNSFVWRRAGRPEALEGAKDDMVMALCGAVWIALKIIPPITKQRTLPSGHQRTPSANTRIKVK